MAVKSRSLVILRHNGTIRIIPYIPYFIRRFRMIRTYEPYGALETHNQAGCPYLNQSGEQAVLNWAHILGEIDPQTLPPNLQAELLQLRARASHRDQWPARA